MLGILALGLTCLMIYTLVKNALLGTQLSSNDTFSGTIDLIIPIAEKSEFHMGPWLEKVPLLTALNGQAKIHVLIDGHHSSINVWKEIQETLPLLTIHHFTTRPSHREAIPWMMEQISPKITSDIVIMADPELVPNQHAFLSLGRLVSQKLKAYFVLPQTEQGHLLGEAIATINPTLALASVYGFRKFRRNTSHSLISLSQGWMGMPLSFFRDFNWGRVNISSWKEALARGWELENKTYILAFGEKHLMRSYSTPLIAQANELKRYWEYLWTKEDKRGAALYLSILFIWSFPVFCFFTHPFWSLASIILLALYRFFSKIVFQESWGAIALHPFGVLFWIATFFWWAIESFKTKYSNT